MELQKVAGIIRFGAFELDSKSGELRKSGAAVPEPDPYFLPRALGKHP